MNKIQSFIIKKAVEAFVKIATKYALIGIQKFSDMIFERLEAAEYTDKAEPLVGQRKRVEFLKFLHREYEDRTKRSPSPKWIEERLEKTWRRKSSKVRPASIIKQDLDRKRFDRYLDRPISWGPRTGKSR